MSSSQLKTSFTSKSTASDVLKGIDLTGQCIIVTGSNSGIGFEAAKSFAANGAEVILACRNKEKAEKACSDIQQALPDCSIEQRTLDLSSFKSIKAFVDSIADKSINALVCNAGVFHIPYTETQDGFESTVGVCHYGHAYLTELLLPNLLSNPTSRVVMVSSESHRQTRALNFDSFPMSKENYFNNSAYAQAKLCNILFAKELQKRYADQGLTATSLHPGAFIQTNFGNHHIATKILFKMLSPFTKVPAQGAASIAFCTAHPDAATLGGSYIDNCKAKKPAKAALNTEQATKLWTHTNEIISKHRI